MTVVLTKKKIGMSSSDKTAQANTIKDQVLATIANYYNALSTYKIGDLVIYNHTLYRCATAITTAEAWNVAHWTAIRYSDVFDEKLSKGDFDGTTGVGYANVASSLETKVGTTDETPFSSATVGIDSDVETGMQKLNKLIAVDVVKNQQINKDHLVETETANDVTFTLNNDGSYTINGTASANGYKAVIDESHYIPTVAGHIYMMFGIVSGLYLQLKDSNDSNTYVYSDAPIFAYSYSNMRINYRFGSSASFNNVKSKLLLIDLTQALGSNDVVNAVIGTGSDQVERLLKFYPQIRTWISYDAGSFQSPKSKYLKTRDYNQWDEDAQLNKAMNTDGSTYTANGYLTSKNLIEVYPGQRYLLGSPWYSSDGVGVATFDANGNNVGYIQAIAYSGTGTPLDYTFVIPNNVRFIKFFVHYKNGSISAYGNDIYLILYWDGSRIGYEPYQEHIIELPNKQGHGILKVVGDKVVADGDELYPDGSGKENFYLETFDGSADEAWELQSINANGIANFNISLTVPTTTDNHKAICNRLIKQTTSIANTTDEGFMFASDYSLYVRLKSSAASTVAEFKTWLASNNLKFIYQRKNPIDLTDQGAFAENFYGDDFGDMIFLDEDRNLIAGLQGCEIFYKANVAGHAESLYVRTDGDSSQVVIQSELEGVDNKHDALYAIMQENMGNTLRHMLAEKYNIDFDNTKWVDMGKQNWVTSSYTFNIQPSDFKSDGKVICVRWKFVGAQKIDGTGTEVGIGYWGPYIVVKDPSMEYDETAFKNAVDGLLMAYEKASS